MTKPEVREHWINAGRAWIPPAFDYPQAWSVEVPRGSTKVESHPVQTLDEAILVTRTLGVDLTVSDETYAFMIDQGFAPATRPGGVGPGGPSVFGFEATMVARSKAEGFVGLTVETALERARRRGLYVREISTEPVTADLCPFRANLHLDDTGRVERVTFG